MDEGIGCRIKTLRESHGMTQEELGSILGLNEAAVQGLESGKDENIRADTIKLLCETFHEYPETLLYGHDYRERVFPVRTGSERVKPGSNLSGISNRDMLLLVRQMIEDVIDSSAFPLMNSLYLLNDVGLSRASMFIDDLLKITEYRKGI